MGMWIDGYMDRWINGQMGRCIDGSMDRWEAIRRLLEPEGPQEAQRWASRKSMLKPLCFSVESEIRDRFVSTRAQRPSPSTAPAHKSWSAIFIKHGTGPYQDRQNPYSQELFGELKF